MKRHFQDNAIRSTEGTSSERSIRCGVSMIESILALSLASMLMIPLVGLLKTNRELWERADSDRVRVNSVHGVLRHVSRQLKSAEQIIAIERRSRRPARLQIRTTNGQTITLSHDQRRQQVVATQGAQSGILADHISQLTFEGLTADGQTTNDLSQMQLIRCTATTDLVRTSNGSTASSHCTVWIRPNR